MGRSSGFRIKLPAAPSRDVEPTTVVGINLAVVYCGFRPRLQRRDRNGFAPFSLFFTPDAESGATPMSAAILTRAERLSTDEISWRRR